MGSLRNYLWISTYISAPSKSTMSVQSEPLTHLFGLGFGR